MPQRVLYLPILESHMHMVVVLIWKVTIVLTILPHLHSDSPLKAAAHVNNVNSTSSTIEDSSRVGIPASTPRKRTHQNAMTERVSGDRYSRVITVNDPTILTVISVPRKELLIRSDAVLVLRLHENRMLSNSGQVKRVSLENLRHNRAYAVVPFTMEK
ncbi:hypothetical protein Tco_1354888 [Tanacetum coccineum]